MTTIINQGYLSLVAGGDTALVYFQRAIVDLIKEPLCEEHEVGAINIFIAGGAQYLIFNIQNIFLTSHADFTAFVDFLKTNDIFTLSIKRDGSNYIEFDGDNTSWTVGIKGKIGGEEKVNYGSTDGTYCIGQIIFVQAS